MGYTACHRIAVDHPTQGAGTGLAIVDGIGAQHGGFVDVLSEPGRGSTFRVFLPAAEARAEPPRPEAPQEEEEPSPRLPGGTETILVVEDDTGVRSMTQTVLEGHGYRVLIAANGEEGIRAFEAHRDEIDLIISDVFMPRMSGDEMYERIRERDPTVPFLFISGYMEEATYRELIVRGRVDYLPKPFSPPDLLTKVRQILDRS